MESGLWFADGGVVSFKGFDYPTRMVVVRLSDGGLWLWSPVERTAAIENEIRALGPVRHIVSPNKLHYLFLGEWQAAFPDASLWATAATIAKRKELRFAGTLADEPPAEWKGQIDQFFFNNSPFMDELIFFHRASRTAIIADLSQTFSETFLSHHWPWWMRHRKALENGRGVGLSADRLSDQFPRPRDRAAQDSCVDRKTSRACRRGAWRGRQGRWRSLSAARVFMAARKAVTPTIGRRTYSLAPSSACVG